jgi:hypothetical protein
MRFRREVAHATEVERAAQVDSTETARHTRFRREVAHTTEVECAAQTLGRDATHSSCYFTCDSHREARDLRDTPELGRARATEALATRATKALATRDGQRRRWTATATAMDSDKSARDTRDENTSQSHTRQRTERKLIVPL